MCVGRADVDDEIIAKVVKIGERIAVIFDGGVIGGSLVSAEVDAERNRDSAFFMALQVLFQALRASVVETHAINKGLVSGQTKETRLWIARLRAWGDSSDFSEAKTEVLPSARSFTVFVETGCKAHRVPEIEAEEFGNEQRIADCQVRPGQGEGRTEAPQNTESEVMRAFRIAAEQDRTEKVRVEQ